MHCIRIVSSDTIRAYITSLAKNNDKVNRVFAVRRIAASQESTMNISSRTDQKKCTIRDSLVAANGVQRTGPMEEIVYCYLCGLPLLLGKCRTDEEGRPVHEECYVKKITANQIKTAIN